MPQITVNNAAIVKKIQSDPKFRADFVSNAAKTLNAAGYSIDEKTLHNAVQTQMGSKPQAASTAIFITIF
jgi:hypothetical protein